MKIRGHQKFRYQLLAQNNGIKLVAHVEDLDETTVSFNYNASHRYIKFEEVLEQLNSNSSLTKLTSRKLTGSFWMDYFKKGQN